MIAIITYDTAHRKTQDIVTKLLLNGYSDLKLVVIPWVERKNFQPLYSHRPNNVVSISIEELAKRINIGFERVEIKMDYTNNIFSKLNLKQKSKYNSYLEKYAKVY